MSNYVPKVVKLLNQLNEQEKNDIKKQSEFVADMIFDNSFNALKENTFFYAFKTSFDFYLQKGNDSLTQVQAFYHYFEQRVIENINTQKPNPLKFYYTSGMDDILPDKLYSESIKYIVMGMAKIFHHETLDFSEEKQTLATNFEEVEAINDKLERFNEFKKQRQEIYIRVLTNSLSMESEESRKNRQNQLNEFLSLVKEHNYFESIISNSSENNHKDKNKKL
jgi:hypothetical protein